MQLLGNNPSDGPQYAKLSPTGLRICTYARHVLLRAGVASFVPSHFMLPHNICPASMFMLPQNVCAAWGLLDSWTSGATPRTLLTHNSLQFLLATHGSLD